MTGHFLCIRSRERLNVGIFKLAHKSTSIRMETKSKEQNTFAAKRKRIKSHSLGWMFDCFQTGLVGNDSNKMRFCNIELEIRICNAEFNRSWPINAFAYCGQVQFHLQIYVIMPNVDWTVLVSFVNKSNDSYLSRPVNCIQFVRSTEFLPWHDHIDVSARANHESQFGCFRPKTRWKFQSNSSNADGSSLCAYPNCYY